MEKTTSDVCQFVKKTLENAFIAAFSKSAMKVDGGFPKERTFVETSENSFVYVSCVLLGSNA